MSKLGDIRAALTTAITDAMPDVRMNGYMATDYATPFFEIDFPEDTVVFDRTFARGSDEMSLILRGVVSVAQGVDGMRRLDDWIDISGAESVKTILEADNTLGGVVDQIRVVSGSGHKRVQIENALFLCVEFTLQVLV